MPKALNIAYTLLCPKCSRVMQSDEYKRGDNFAILECNSVECIDNSVRYKLKLGTVELEEIKK